MNELKNHTEMPKIDKTDNMREIKPDKPLSQNELKNKVADVFEEARIKKEFNHDNCETTYEERCQRASDGDGVWKDKVGDSLFIPNNEEAKEVLREKGQDGIRYIDGEPDLSKVAEATVKIDDMTANREKNFKQADEKLAEIWNQEARNNKTDWKPRDAKNYRKDQKLSWHERCDTKTMDLVPRPIHEECKHIGGVAECKRKETGGKFDE